MANVLVVLEQRDGTLKRVALEALAAGRALADHLGGEVHAIALGPPGLSVEAAGAHGADKVFVATDEAVRLYQSGPYAATIAAKAKEAYTAVLLGATALGKDLAPRLAARLVCPLASDATEVAVEGGALVVQRPIFAGKANLRLRVTAAQVVVSLRPNNFRPVEAARAGAVESIAVVDAGGARTTSVKAPEHATVDVAEAAIVVAGGRGLKDAEHFAILDDLAAAFGGQAAVGASRAVVDAGWRAHAEQVGQTGKTVSPNLYIAVGISGAIQHLAGMRTAKVIVAINKDKDAPIFKAADYGIVGDLFEVVPRLTEEVRRIRSA
ncbi:MAG: electron transfer flavoprotein subunit alpha/FixB family protein [Gemmatimonadota bacterium]|nr:electron transfer flavoprotein subunit alpha/FixB family protein [Gemmatimonadota bacterium]MDH4350777.1 electron transfer flavoprotein subunit alpha/FixB family protein [Gemmatimonadota bacterium]MDH5197498.1 electron transfer flavoprotein subunit alpha/FixB family protein [Gemmatimonadota bacterium]